MNKDIWTKTVQGPQKRQGEKQQKCIRHVKPMRHTTAQCKNSEAHRYGRPELQFGLGHQRLRGGEWRDKVPGVWKRGICISEKMGL